MENLKQGRASLGKVPFCRRTAEYVEREARVRYLWIASLIVGLAAGVFVSSYVFYYAPVTQDRFGHLYFSGYVSERVSAYWKLFKSRKLHGIQSVPRAEIETYVDKHACEIGVPATLTKAVIWFESSFRADHISTTGAMGLMALMPKTAAMLGVEDPFNPFDNVRGGMRLLKRLGDQFDGDLALVAAAYNAGPGAVRRYGGVPPYRETEDYVRSIRVLYEALRGETSNEEGAGIRRGRDGTNCREHDTL